MTTHRVTFHDDVTGEAYVGDYTTERGALAAIESVTHTFTSSGRLPSAVTRVTTEVVDAEHPVRQMAGGPGPFYLAVGKTIVNARSPYPSLAAARDGVAERQDRDRNCGWRARTYQIIRHGQVVDTMEPTR